jgi:DNA-binding NtrC family response regulator
LLAPGEDLAAAKKRVAEGFERAAIAAALAAHDGNVSAAARALGLLRQNLQAKLRELGIAAEQFRE